MCDSTKIVLEAFQSPQWGNNSKGVQEIVFPETYGGFSPRNGEIILKKKT